jgi:HD-like signal output (HDOD) protein
MSASADSVAAPDSSAEAAAQSLVKDNVKLVSLPHVCIRVNLMVGDPDCTAQEVGTVISQDASLSARLLKIANSPLYGYRSKIDTISRAVTVIGQRELRDLVFAVSAVKTFSSIPVDLANMASFWRHSMFTGIVARLLAKRCHVLHTERLFVAGLLHDLGQLLIYHKLPEEAQRILRRSEALDEPLFLSERHLIQIDHAMVGGALASLWELPELLRLAIRFHHEPEQAPQCLEAALVHLADVISRIAEFPDRKSVLIERSSRHAWRMTGLDEEVIEDVIRDAHPLLFEGLAIIMPNAN